MDDQMFGHSLVTLGPIKKKKVAYKIYEKHWFFDFQNFLNLTDYI